MLILKPQTKIHPSSPRPGLSSEDEMFYYFAYGSCMCPVDLERSLGEDTHNYVIGPATLKNYRLGFYFYSQKRQCGALDVVKSASHSVEGVLYRLPWRLSKYLDERECVAQSGYRHEMVNIHHQNKVFQNVRTYVTVNKLKEELAPNDWYSGVVLRGAKACGLSEQYCCKLFAHIHQLRASQEEMMGLQLAAS